MSVIYLEKIAMIATIVGELAVSQEQKKAVAKRMVSYDFRHISHQVMLARPIQVAVTA